jgi:hypothetical protein
MRFNFRSAKNAIDLPSGDQNGKVAPSVPGGSLPAVEFSGRNHSGSRPSKVNAATRRRPSGEIASCGKFAGGETLSFG